MSTYNGKTAIDFAKIVSNPNKLLIENLERIQKKYTEEHGDDELPYGLVEIESEDDDEEYERQAEEDTARWLKERNQKLVRSGDNDNDGDDVAAPVFG